MTLLRCLFWLTVGLSILLIRLLRVVGRVLLWSCSCAGLYRRATHGSARWATWWDLATGRAWGGDSGIIVGRAWGRFIRFRGDGATLVYAPMGKGKGVGLVIPNLLEYPGAVVCTDPKGENFAITRRHRATLGPVFRLDAIHPEASHHFNPFELLRAGTAHEADDCAMLADFLVRPGGVDDTHWDKSARALLAAVIQHVLNSRPLELRTLSTVRGLIASDEEVFLDLLRDMAASSISPIAEAGWDALSSHSSEEMASIKKNAALAMLLWSRDRIGGMLTMSSDFDLMDLHRQPMTVYVMVPEDALTVYAPFLRVMMGCSIVAMVRGKHLPRPRHKPFLLFDECAALGRLDALEQGLGYLREYAHTMLVFQDLGQLRSRYGESGARTFMAAAGCQVSFGVSDGETAHELAESIGRTTVLSHSVGDSHGSTDILRRQYQSGHTEAGRYLVDPSEIRRLSANKAVVFLQDQVAAPILATKIKYYKERRWRGRYDSWRAPSPAEPAKQRTDACPAAGRAAGTEHT